MNSALDISVIETGSCFIGHYELLGGVVSHGLLLKVVQVTETELSSKDLEEFKKYNRMKVVPIPMLDDKRTVVKMIVVRINTKSLSAGEEGFFLSKGIYIRGESTVPFGRHLTVGYLKKFAAKKATEEEINSFLVIAKERAVSLRDHLLRKETVRHNVIINFLEQFPSVLELSDIELFTL